MRLVLHPKVCSDVDAIMAYYERVASRERADDFYAELRRFMLDAAERPKSFSIRERDLRCINLHRFPYHFLFRINRRFSADPCRAASSEASFIGHPSAMKQTPRSELLRRR